MRRHLVTVLFGLGAFLATAALILRFHGSGQLEAADKDPGEVITMVAADATVFVPSTQTEITTDVTVKQKNDGDPAAAEKAPDGVVVWFTTTTRTVADGTVVQRSMARTAMDARSAEVEPCCESFAEVVDQAISEDRRTGLVLKFPAGTEPRDHEMWDSTVGKPVTATYVDEVDVDGVTAYRFKVVIPQTVVGTREVIASTIGLASEGTVETERSYSLDRTLFIEPRTGAILNDVQDISDTLVLDGKVVRTLFDGSLAYTDEQVQANADENGSRASELRMVHDVLPLSGLVLGLGCIAAGAVLQRSAGRRRAVA